MIRLGPFELSEPIGRGGMGEIWSATHDGGVPVAVKVLTSRRAQDEAFRASFRKEVEAIAGLDHDNIVMVYDHGEVSADAARHSDGRLVAGSPYLAMELLEGGSLASQKGRLQWTALRDVLLRLLGALAHAHARRVLHRDIKPGNVLVSGSGPKLTDFGLAHPTEPILPVDDETRARGGTPSYMAPEQFQAGWRDYGPWTDLYSFGCMAWALSTGRPPFRGQTWVKTMHMHLTRQLPKLRPRQPVPAGFEEWLRRLLRKDPRARFRRAADAAWALLEIDGPLQPVHPDVSTNPLPATVIPRTTLFWTDDDLPRTPPELVPDGPITSFTAPRLPASWRQDHSRRAITRLNGAGLGLYGLRQIPVVGRESERDVLWGALRDVQEERHVQVVALEGPVGCGKTRLAEWLCERAHEVGAAIALRAVHAASPGPPHGLAAMMERHLRCVGLTRPEVEERIQADLQSHGVRDEYEWRALAELVRPSRWGAAMGAGSAAIRFASPTERHVLLRRMLQRLCTERSVVLWLDDVQWAAESLAFVRHLVETHPWMPVLVVLTAEAGALAQRPAEGTMYEDLLAHRDATRIAVRKLSKRHTRDLLRELLGFDGDLADSIELRVDGNPLFAVQLVGDWVQRGLLVPSDKGFRLADGAVLKLPDDLHAMWSDATERVLARRPVGARIALELAVTLGVEFTDREWVAACRIAGCGHPRDVAEAMVRARLLVHTEEGRWRLAHGMFRESLIRTMREKHRWARHNRTCVDMLRELWADDLPAVHTRLGQHLLEAGDLEQAMPLLLAGAERMASGSVYRRALDLLDGYDRAADILGLRPHAVERVHGWLARARVFSAQGRVDQARRWADRAADAVRSGAAPELRAGTLERRGHVLRRCGELDEAERCYLKALQLYREGRGDDHGAGRCMYGLGHVGEHRGRYDRAVEMFEQAYAALEGAALYRALCVHGAAVAAQHAGDMESAGRRFRTALESFRAVGSRSGEARCLDGLAVVVRILERDVARSEQLQQQALDLFEQLGDPEGQHSATNGLAEIARFKGDLEAAEQGYVRALELGDAIGIDVFFVRLNLALVRLRRRNYDESCAMLEPILEELNAAGRRGLMAGAHIALMLCHLGNDDYDGFVRHFAAGRQLIEETGVNDLDIAWPAETAGELAADNGHADMARACLELALFQYRSLGSTPDVRRLQRRLRGL